MIKFQIFGEQASSGSRLNVRNLLVSAQGTGRFLYISRGSDEREDVDFSIGGGQQLLLFENPWHHTTPLTNVGNGYVVERLVGWDEKNETA